MLESELEIVNGGFPYREFPAVVVRVPSDNVNRKTRSKDEK